MFGLGNNGGGPKGAAFPPADQLVSVECQCGSEFFETKLTFKAYLGGLFGDPAVVPVTRNFCKKCGKELEIDIKAMREKHKTDKQ